MLYFGPSLFILKEERCVFLFAIKGALKVCINPLLYESMHKLTPLHKSRLIAVRHKGLHKQRFNISRAPPEQNQVLC